MVARVQGQWGCANRTSVNRSLARWRRLAAGHSRAGDGLAPGVFSNRQKQPTPAATATADNTVNAQTR
jgi:hypothetical protein